MKNISKLLEMFQLLVVVFVTISWLQCSIEVLVMSTTRILGLFLSYFVLYLVIPRYTWCVCVYIILYFLSSANFLFFPLTTIGV